MHASKTGFDDERETWSSLLILALTKRIFPIKKHLCIMDLERYGLLKGLDLPVPEQGPGLRVT